MRGHLQEERGLTNARIAADENERTGHQPAAEDTIHLAHRERHAAEPLARDRGERLRARHPNRKRAEADARDVAGRRLRNETTSSSVPQASHSGQRPRKAGLSYPHALQTYLTR